MGGDLGRWFDREREKELIGLSATVMVCGQPKWTFAFDLGGSLLSVGTWDDSGNMVTENPDSFIDQFSQDDNDLWEYILNNVGGEGE